VPEWYYNYVGEKMRVELVGGLGNQLNCYFAGLYFAMEYNYSEVIFNFGTANRLHLHPKVLHSCIPRSIYYNGERKISTSIIDQPRNANMIGKIRKLGDIPYGIYKLVVGKFEDAPLIHLDSYQYHHLCDLNLHRLGIKRKRNLVLDGFFQSFRFFDKAMDKVSGVESMISFSYLDKTFIKSQLLNKVDSKYKCTIHLRVGDLRTPGQEVFGVLSESYYLHAIEFVTHKFPGIEIKILSDNEKLAHYLYPNLIKLTDGFYAGMDVKSPLESFEIIRNSMVVIAANSGFSLWASKLSSEIQLCVIPDKPHKTLLGFRDIPKSWVKIENDFI
jgi:hypothetical protein